MKRKIKYRLFVEKLIGTIKNAFLNKMRLQDYRRNKQVKIGWRFYDVTFSIYGAGTVYFWPTVAMFEDRDGMYVYGLYFLNIRLYAKRNLTVELLSTLIEAEKKDAKKNGK